MQNTREPTLFWSGNSLPIEALTAIVFALGVAITFLFLPIEQAETALVGDITKVGVYETIITVILCILIFLPLGFFSNYLSFSYYYLEK